MLISGRTTELAEAERRLGCQLKDDEHFVHLYEDDASLVSTVQDYVREGLRENAGIILIATEEHHRGIRESLLRNGLDFDAALQRNQITCLDAQATLARLMINDSLDPVRFRNIIEPLLDDQQKRWPKVRAFGEMVALLWAEGNRSAACQLEALWTSLMQQRRGFTLFCAYPLSGFRNDTDGAAIMELCGHHATVIPGKDLPPLPSGDPQTRQIVQLQQKSQRLEAAMASRSRAERELADFLENALEGLHKVGPDGRILWANQAELDMLGYEAHEYIGRHIADFHVDGHTISSMLCRLLAGEKLLNQPARLRCKDGSIREVLVHSNAHFEDGKLVYTRCFTRDMTEIKKAEGDRAMLAAIVASSQDAIVSKSVDGTILSWNEGAQQIFGYSADEAVGEPIYLIVPPERHDEERSVLERLKRGERVEHFETVRLAKGGKRVNISETISPLRDGSGKLIGASKVARDITQRKWMEQQLREKEESFRRLMEVLPVGVYTCEAPSGRLNFWNEHAVNLWGREPQPGDKYCGSYKIFKPDGAPVAKDECPMAVAVQKGCEFRNMEVEVERPDGSRIVALVNIAPIRDPAGNVVGAINVFQDLSALKRAERQLKESDRRKDEFLATLAHELRNPLAPIRNSLHILKMSGQNAAHLERVHNMMERQLGHLVRLVDDLLEISRVSRGKIELKRQRVALRSVLEHAIETSRPVIDNASHKLNIHLPEELVWVEGDSVRLSQVFSNLLNNAAKYTPQGGSITVSVRSEGTNAVVSVKDNGSGIPQEMLTQIFEIFVQVDNPLRGAREGLGIGLSLVRSLVEMHGGTVEAHSGGVGKGSEFIVRLPLAATEEAQRAASTGTAPHQGALRGSSVLIVDDNHDSAESLGLVLECLGAEVHVRHSARGALQEIPVLRPKIIFMDIGMPDMDGCQAATLIRRNPEIANVRLIAMTGWGQERDRQRSHAAGFDHHLVKPVDLEVVRKLIEAPAAK